VNAFQQLPAGGHASLHGKIAIVSNKQKTKNRRDHYLPQGYLRSFIDPARAHLPKPLWCFHLGTNKWKERSAKQIGYIDGFYDYAIENTVAEHPDIQHGPPARQACQRTGGAGKLERRSRSFGHSESRLCTNMT
jgi:hypothetical protein